MITTMCVRQDVRPVILFYVNRDWESVIFRERLDELAHDMPNLEVVHVLRRAPAGWRGETGRITARLLHRHLPKQYRRFEFFVCGPEALMDTVEEALATLEVPLERVHTERFSVV
jgi:ferredoxin-NADP reductase